MDNRTIERLRRLAEQARGTEARAKTDRAVRDDAIVEADQEGFGVREIARATELDPSRIARILGERLGA